MLLNLTFLPLDGHFDVDDSHKNLNERWALILFLNGALLLAVPLGPNQRVLPRQDDEETGGNRPMISAPRVEHADEFAQAIKRDEGKQSDDAELTQHKGQGRNAAHQPPRAHARVVIGHHAARAALPFVVLEQQAD